MNARTIKGWRGMLLVMSPLGLIVGLLLAFSGPFNAAASAQYQYGDPCWGGHNPINSPFGVNPDTGKDWWPAPNMCTATPWGVNDNPFADALGIDASDKPIDGVPTASEVQTWLKDGDPNNPGKTVHIIDVRVPEEQFDGVAPCLTAIKVPTFPVTNAGHPIWKDKSGKWVESYHVPIFVGFYWAGTNIDEGAWQPNIRPEPNPNFLALGYQDSSGNQVTLGGYFKALKDQGEIADGDSFVFTCQTGWRAAYAATIFKNLPGFGNSKVYDLYGGFRGWNDAVDPDKVINPANDTPGPASGGVVIDPAPSAGYPDGKCANVTGKDANQNPVIDANNPFPCDTSKRLRVLPGFSTTTKAAYDHVTGAATDPLVADRWAYNVTRLAQNDQPVMWDGVETHVGQKPEWHTGFGAGDFKLGLTAANARWADYGKRLLAVDYVVQNNPADYMGNNGNSLNYYDECGGAPAPQGGCHPVLHAPWGPAYNLNATGAKSDNGVTFVSTSSSGAAVLPGGLGMVTVTYQVPEGVTSFNGKPVVTATDIPDPQKSFFGASFDWFFTYTYSNWQGTVNVPGAPLL